ncbi:MAG: hypothetical protein IPK82_01075 [Polyangiaceae bacterium]|nr:hypothetical protein [Polyangiaceae bacterium]
MKTLVEDFFTRHPEIRLAALGAGANESALDLCPFGQKAQFFAAEKHPQLVERYRAANQYAFPGALALPGWVLSDLYLLPGVIGLLMCDARELKPALRKKLDLTAEDEAIAAAYVAAPSVVPGLAIGVSLISLLPAIHAGAWVKTLTIKMMRLNKLRGVAQWANPAVRVHTRMGPLRVVGSVPGTHEFRSKSFVYETDLSDEEAWADAMGRKKEPPPTRKIAATHLDELAVILERAENGERIYVVPPGLDTSGNVLLREE